MPRPALEIPAPVFIVLLAAGRSSRMQGGHKLLLPWGDGTVLRHVAQTAVAAAPTLVVLPPDAPALAAAVAGLDLRVVINAQPDRGMASSLVVALEALDDQAGAVLIALADMPAITRQDFAQVINAWPDAQGRPIIRPHWHGQPGNPVLFDRSMFDQLRNVQGDQGARALIQADPTRLRLIAAASDAVLIDIDTAEAYAAARRRQDAIG